MEKKLILQLASPPGEALWELYEALNWNRHVKQPAAGLELAHRQAFRTAAMYDGEKLVGVGRVVSDGVIAALLCGLGVHPGSAGGWWGCWPLNAPRRSFIWSCCANRSCSTFTAVADSNRFWPECD